MSILIPVKNVSDLSGRKIVVGSKPSQVTFFVAKFPSLLLKCRSLLWITRNPIENTGLVTGTFETLRYLNVSIRAGQLSCK